VTDVVPTPELVAYLQGDAALTSLVPGGVWEDPAPADRSSRFCVLAFQTSSDQVCGGGSRVTEFYYLAKIVGEAEDIAGIRLAAMRLDALLHFGPLIQEWLPGYNVLSAQRIEAVAYPDPEPSTGIRYMHRGGQYRFDLEAA
jgi:hypothetical protein